MKKIDIFTDGACKGNPGPGGWGAVLQYNGVQKELFGGENNTTNNRMELLAAIKALEVLTEPCDVTLTTDSNYVKDGINSWIANWKKNGWRTAAKKEVKNKDLWIQLDDACQKHQMTWRWVKGHSGHTQNELADDLANRGVETMRRQS